MNMQFGGIDPLPLDNSSVFAYIRFLCDTCIAFDIIISTYLKHATPIANSDNIFIDELD